MPGPAECIEKNHEMSLSFKEAMDMLDQSPAELMEMDHKYNAHNYHSMPFVCSKGEGVYLYDNTGRKCYDFLACYGAANQGHAHPKIVSAVKKQMKRLPLCSRAFYSDVLPVYAKYITSFFGYDRVLPMNTGVEGVETAMKLVRKWAYQVKGVKHDEAKIIFAKNNFWGRSIAAVSASTDPEAYSDYGPYVPNFLTVNYNDVKSLEDCLVEHAPNVAAFCVEPIQGEAGVIVPDADYLKRCHELCKQHNVLLVCDEVQSGLCRTGHMLCSNGFGVRPDIVVLGKALTGGVLPASAVLASDEVMLVIKPGQHGSTYGGCPVGCVAAMAALEILKDEKLDENAQKMGEIFRKEMNKVASEVSYIHAVRGMGLMNAVQMKEDTKYTAWDVCEELMKADILCKPTRKTTIRFTPPLIISESEMKDACSRIVKVFESFEGKM